MNLVRLYRSFASYTPDKDQAKKQELNDRKAREFAEVVNGQCPDNHEKELALAKIEEASMWASMSIKMGEEE